MGKSNRIMNVFRAVAHTTTGIWLGGIIVIAIVAQTTFGEMRKTGVDTPNAVAGQVMARNFIRFEVVQVCCAATLLAWQVASLIAGHRSVRDWLRVVCIAGAAALLVYHGLVLTPKIADLQPILAQPDADAAIRTVFAKFHTTAVRVSQAMLFLLACIMIEMALPPPRTGKELSA